MHSLVVVGCLLLSRCLPSVNVTRRSHCQLLSSRVYPDTRSHLGPRISRRPPSVCFFFFFFPPITALPRIFPRGRKVRVLGTRRCLLFLLHLIWFSASPSNPFSLDAAYDQPLHSAPMMFSLLGGRLGRSIMLYPS